MLFKSRILGALALASTASAALQVDLNSPASIRKAAQQVADDLLTFYDGDKPGKTPGILPGPPPAGPYYWWTAGAMWGTLLDYWHYTGDAKFNPTIKHAMMHQVGEQKNFMPRNWSLSMGNDDQAFWGMTAMIAAETGFEDPPPTGPQWLALAQAVFNDQTDMSRRAPDGNCKWGLRWQAYQTNNGWDYINTIANGCYFNIGARLARYTNNATYAEYASKTWDFLTRLKYIDDDYNVYDGAHYPKQCTDVNRAQFSYNSAIMMQGAAYLYNFTSDAVWKDRVNKLVDQTIKVFFEQGAAYEIACETGGCNEDMETFKGFMHRWMAQTALLVPETKARIMPVLKNSTLAAVKQCTGGANGRMCGFHWTSGVFDGELGAAQQMNVVAALSSLLIDEVKLPLTNATGGTSIGDPLAGGLNVPPMREWAPVTTGDKAGAAILTMLLIGGGAFAFFFMSKE